MTRVLLLSLWILAIGWWIAQDALGQMMYEGHVSDTKGNVVEYATVVLLSGEVQVAGAVTNGECGRYFYVACRFYGRNPV